MNVYAITVLIAGCFVIPSLAKPSASSTITDKDRNKRSLFKNEGAHKRSFDTLDLDMLFSDPMFQEFENEQKLNSHHSNDLHEAFDLSDLDLDPAVPDHLDSLHAATSGAEADYTSSSQDNMMNELPASLEALSGSLHHDLLELPAPAKVKDEMSNVVPGAQGPFDHHPPGRGFAQHTDVYHPPAHTQQIADNMMEDFLEYVYLREMGLLDRCMGPMRRK